MWPQSGGKQREAIDAGSCAFVLQLRSSRVEGELGRPLKLFLGQFEDVQDNPEKEYAVVGFSFKKRAFRGFKC